MKLIESIYNASRRLSYLSFGRLGMKTLFLIFIFCINFSCANRREKQVGNDKNLSSVKNNNLLQGNEFYLDGQKVKADEIASLPNFAYVTSGSNGFITHYENLSKNKPDEDTTGAQLRTKLRSWPNATVYYIIDTKLKNDSFYTKDTFSCVSSAKGFTDELNKVIAFFTEKGFYFVESTTNDDPANAILITSFGSKQTISTFGFSGGIQPLALGKNFCGQELINNMALELGIPVSQEKEAIVGADASQELKASASESKKDFIDASQLKITNLNTKFVSAKEDSYIRVTFNKSPQANAVSYALLSDDKSVIKDYSEDDLKKFDEKIASLRLSSNEGSYALHFAKNFPAIIQQGEIYDGSALLSSIEDKKVTKGEGFDIWLPASGTYRLLVAACIPQGLNKKSPRGTEGINSWDLACGDGVFAEIGADKNIELNKHLNLLAAEFAYFSNPVGQGRISDTLATYAANAKSCRRVPQYVTALNEVLAKYPNQEMDINQFVKIYFSPDGAQSAAIPVPSLALTTIAIPGSKNLDLPIKAPVKQAPIKLDSKKLLVGDLGEIFKKYKEKHPNSNSDEVGVNTDAAVKVSELRSVFNSMPGKTPVNTNAPAELRHLTVIENPKAVTQNPKDNSKITKQEETPSTTTSSTTKQEETSKITKKEEIPIIQKTAFKMNRLMFAALVIGGIFLPVIVVAGSESECDAQFERDKAKLEATFCQNSSDKKSIKEESNRLHLLTEQELANEGLFYPKIDSNCKVEK